MNNLGPWIRATVGHLKQHWKLHLPGVLVFFGVIWIGSMLMTWAFLAAGLVIAIVAAIIGSELIAVLAALLFFGLVLVGSLLLGLAVVPFWFGYIRQVLKIHRGEPTGHDDLLWGYRNLGPVFLLALLQGGVGLVAALACYLPAFFVGVLFLFNIPIMADRELDAVSTMKASVALVKPHYLELLVAMFAITFASVALAYIPIVGSFAMLMAYAAFLVVVYDDLSQRDREGHPGA